MDPYDMDPTPEERQAALIQAIKMRMGGQQQPEQADAYRAWGNLGQLSGDRVLAPFGQNQVQQAQQMDSQGSRLLGLLGKGPKANNALETNRGMLQALKTDFPDIAAQYPDGSLNDASAGKLWAQANNARHTNLVQDRTDRRTNIVQDRTDTRFGKTNALHTQKQAADLGAREVYGSNPLDPANPKPISQAQAEHLADMKAAADTVIEKTHQAKAIYAKGAPLPGSEGDAYIRQLITETYGPMLKTGNIGNLTDSHLHLLQDMLKNPSSDWRTYFNNKLFPSMLDALAKAAEENTEHQARSIGKTFRKPKASPSKEGSFDLGGAQHPPGWSAEKQAEYDALAKEFGK